MSPTCANANEKMRSSNHYRQHVSSAKGAYDDSPSPAVLEALRTVCNDFTGDTSGFGTPTTCQVSIHIQSEAEKGTRTWEQGPRNWIDGSATWAGDATWSRDVAAAFCMSHVYCMHRGGFQAVDHSGHLVVHALL